MHRVSEFSSASAERRLRLPVGQIVAVSFLVILGCQSKDSSSGTTIASSETAMSVGGNNIKEPPAEKAIAPEKNPPGAIAKNESFVTYKSASGGYQLDVPKGWASTVNGPNVTFVSQYDGLNVAISSSNSPPTATSVKDNEARLIQAQGRAVKIEKVKSVKEPAGNAVEIDYSSNSEPDAASKAVRLQNTAYLFFNNGTVGWLTWWAPEGADVRALSRSAKTFKWL